MSKNNKAVFVVGPTASGKTALSIEIAKCFDGEIISADSMQIYRGIHIASAAPDEEEKQGIRHHMLEFLSTDEEFSVADYVKCARECIDDVISRGKLPVIVGGTGLYINSLLDNTEFISENSDANLRENLEAEFDKSGGEKMLERLAEFDKESALRLHPNNRRRIIRAFEVYMQTGKTITEQNLLSHNKEWEIEPLVIGITYNDRELLYERINKRVEIMIENGLLDEAEQNFNDASNKGAFQAIGHKELFGYLKGEMSLEEAKELLCRQTRRYAKRQLTWFRRDNRIEWIYADLSNSVIDDAIKKVKNFLLGG